jgi:hypothetical protein
MRKVRFTATLAATFTLALVVSACDALLNANFDHAAGSNDGEGGAERDGASGGDLPPGSGSIDGAAASDGASGGQGDAATQKDAGTLTDGSSTGRSALDIFGPGQLKAWFLASKDVFTTGATPLVLAWNDQSGNAAHGGPAGAGGGQLTRLPSDPNLGGLPAVQVDSDALTLGAKSPSIAATDDFYIGVVARYTLLGGAQDRFLFSRLSSFPHGYALYAGSAAGAGIAGTLDANGIIQPSSNTGTADGHYRVYALRRTNSNSGGNVTMQVRVNGAVTSATIPNGTAITDPNRPLLFGGSLDIATLDRFMIGAFAEIVVISGTTTDASINELETNLRLKYGTQ